MPIRRKSNWRKQTARERKAKSYRTGFIGPQRGASKIIVPRYTTPFPPQYKIKLVYTGWVNNAFAADGTNNYSTYQFKLNSCHDPYAGISGTYNIQPYFWDQISAIYKRYLVTSAKVEYKACNPNVTSAFGLLRPSTVSTSPTDFQLEESRPYASKAIATTGGNGLFMKRYYPVHKIHGVSPQKVKSDDLYASTVGSDPSLMLYLNLMQVNADGTTTANAMPMNVKITQYVTMFDRTIVSAS